MKDEISSQLETRHTKDASVAKIGNGFRMSIRESAERAYRDAQLDDYGRRARRDFPHEALSLSLRARASSASIAGTWGFGLWNDPFGLSLGFGGNPFRLPALPNAAWFFYASEENYLSFKSPSTSAYGEVANGFMAQTFRSPAFHPLLIPAGLALPFSRKATRRLLGRVIEEDARALRVDVAQWHGYRLEWSPKRVLFEVDHVKAFETPVSPRVPMGIIVWIDNQFAAFRPNGKIEWGVLNGKEEWIEIEDIKFQD